MDDRLKTLVPALAGRRVLVIGDVMMDEYLTGRATRLSREAPIPVLEFESRQLFPGGAANPAANITALDSHAVQIAVIGADAEAAALRDVLRARGIDVSGLVADSTRPTTMKTRVMAQMGLRFPQQVARLDRLSREPISEAIEQALCAIIEDCVADADAILFSDYDGGLITPPLVEAALRMVEGKDVLITADAQGKFDKYAGIGLMKCNADDARAYLRRDIETDEQFAFAARDLYRMLRVSRAVVITRGADGATVCANDGMAEHVPTPTITDVYDTVGAGDTSIAVLTLAMAVGASAVDAARLANYASGLVVRRVGNYTPTPDEIARALDG